MDSSGFQYPLAKRLKERYPNREIIYYILPQVWASPSKIELKSWRSIVIDFLGILPQFRKIWTYLTTKSLEIIGWNQPFLPWNGRIILVKKEEFN